MLGSAPKRSTAKERGVTLIELMISMVIGSILIGLVFAVHTRMSSAFQAQSEVSKINQSLIDVRKMIVEDLRMAGFGMHYDGPFISSNIQPNSALFEQDSTPQQAQPLVVVNNVNGTGPDSFRILSVEGFGSATMRTWTNGLLTPLVNDTSPFTQGDVVMVSRMDPRDRNAWISCLLEISAIWGPTAVIFRYPGNSAPHFNQNLNAHCTTVEAAGEPWQIHRAKLRAYRIDPNRRSASILQRDDTGGFLGDWKDLAAGVTNLQIATRFYEENDTTDLDGDGDPERDWYSGEAQEADDPTDVRPGAPGDPTGIPIEIAISIETRSRDSLNNTAVSALVPVLGDYSRPKHNSVGDFVDTAVCSPGFPCGQNLITTPRPERYRGDHIYRSSTIRVDLRNMGVGIESRSN